VDPLLFNNAINNQGVWRKSMGLSPDDFVLLYAGIMGYDQGLNVITDVTSSLHTNQRIKFIFLGNGPEKERLQQIVSEKNLTNVLFHDFV
jgi:colanic acid biosynthesis glycosyl transferase WcaI